MSFAERLTYKNGENNGYKNEYKNGEDYKNRYKNRSSKITSNNPIDNIQARILAIRNVSAKISTLSAGDPSLDTLHEHHSLMMTAKVAVNDVAQALHSESSLESDVSNQLLHDKLSQNYETAIRELESASQRHLQAEQARIEEATKVATMLPPKSKVNPNYVRDDNDRRVYPSSSNYYNHLPDGPPMSPTIAQSRCLVPMPVESTAFEQALLSDREKEIKQIQGDLRGIHELYEQLALHVDTQGADLDNIEAKVKTAEMHTEGAATEVGVAQVYYNTRSRQMAVLGVIIILTIGVIALLLRRIEK